MSVCSRKFGAVALAGAVVAGLAACGDGSESADGPEQVNVYLAQHAWSDSLRDLIPEFEEQSGMSVNLTMLGEDQLSQQYSVKFNAGATDVDVMMLHQSRDGLIARQNGWLADISDYVQSDSDWDWEDFPEVTREAVTDDDGVVYGVPLVSERSLLYYRTDLLEEAGLSVPETFEELEAAAAALTDPSADQYGFVARGAGAVAVPTASSFVYGFGGGWDTDDGISRLAEAETVDGLTFFGDLLSNYGPPGVLNMNWPEAIAVFQQGNAAMATEVDALYGNFIDPEASRVVDNVGYAPFPAGPAGHYVSNIVPWSLAVPESSPHTDAGWDFVRWATSPEVSAQLLADGNPVTRTSAWEDPDAASAYPPELAEIIADPGDITYIDHTSPRVINVGQSRDIIGTVLSTAIDGGDTQAAADAADAELQALLDSEAQDD